MKFLRILLIVLSITLISTSSLKRKGGVGTGCKAESTECLIGFFCCPDNDHKPSYFCTKDKAVKECRAGTIEPKPKPK